MSAPEAFPGVYEWEKFAATCATAEAARDHAKEAAKSEKDRVVNFSKNKELCQWNALPRVESAANARYERKAKDAEEECERACEAAQETLMEKLGEAAQ
jgi:hypothetical protein